MTGAKRGRPRRALRPGEVAARVATRRLADLQRYYRTDPRVAWARAAISTARGRAKRLGLVFAIEAADLLAIAGDTCPALGIRLDYSRGRVTIQDDSPTVDRIIPPIGYVRGNIAVISNRANKIKGACGPAELFAVGRWHGKELSRRPPWWR